MSQGETESALSEAHRLAKEAHSFALSTGAPYRDTPGEDGISQKSRDRFGLEKSVITNGASITRTNGGRLETDVSLPMGEYSAGFYTRDGKEDNPMDDVVIERPGYLGSIEGSNSKRATEIIARRAAKEVGEIAAKRSISLGTEYLKRRIS
jgi:hypothetical protein